VFATAIEVTYRYPFASGLSNSSQGLGLCLATCGLSHEHPQFFERRMRELRVVGCLLADGEQDSEGEKGP